MKKYTYGFDQPVGPEDAETGRCFEVVYTQPWQDGAYLPPVASRCTEADAKRIADCLNACEGVLAENLDVNKLVEDHALLKIKYNNLRCDGLDHLRNMINMQNGHGQYSSGGAEYHTTAGRMWRDANAWLALQG